MFTLSPAHTDLLMCDVSYPHWHDLLHTDPTLLLFSEDREIAYVASKVLRYDVFHKGSHILTCLKTWPIPAFTPQLVKHHSHSSTVPTQGGMARLSWLHHCEKWSININIKFNVLNGWQFHYTKSSAGKRFKLLSAKNETLYFGI